MALTLVMHIFGSGDGGNFLRSGSLVVEALVLLLLEDLDYDRGFCPWVDLWLFGDGLCRFPAAARRWEILVCRCIMVLLISGGVASYDVHCTIG